MTESCCNVPTPAPAPAPIDAKQVASVALAVYRLAESLAAADVQATVVQSLRAAMNEVLTTDSVANAMAQALAIERSESITSPAVPEGGEVRIIRATPPSSDCWSDVRDLLAERNRRMQGSMIASELARVGLAWSARSLETTLAEARRSGLLDHVRGEGYMVTDRGRGLSLNEVRRIWGLRVTEEVAV